MRGDRETAVVQRRSGRVAALTGLDPALVLRLGGRIPSDVFRRERGRQDGFVASAYDATDNVLDAFPESSSNRADSGLGSLLAPFTTAMQMLYGSHLNWHAQGQYRLLNNDVARAWSYGPGGRLGHEAVSDLRESLALDPKLRVLVAHGLFDLVTPYFQSKLILDQIPLTVGADRVHLTAYPGGHMFYLNDASRTAFREDALTLYKAALENWRS
jgi:carboxypeptidase C (cathepsin A)